MASHTTLEVKFLELLEAKQSLQTSRPKIQKVPQYLRNGNKFDKHYSPKSVSIGPILHDNQNLKLGENYKLIWAAKYIRNTQFSPEFLHKKIFDNIDELKVLFADDVLALTSTAESLKGFRSLEEKLSWLLFVDGCFLLYILDVKVNRIFDDQHDNQEDNIKFDQLFLLLMTDVLLLENQLPFLVLKLLWKNDKENELIDTMMNFLTYYHWAVRDIQDKLSNESQPPTHLLDLHRKMILTTSNHKTKKRVKYSKSKQGTRKADRNIEDLRASGVKLKSSGTARPSDIHFRGDGFSAQLTLPEIFMDNITTSSFLNLIAYEMCPDFKNDYGITSFAVFMDSLIDHAEDVKILRSKGILVNSRRSDEEVADLFNIISTDLIFNPETYFEVKTKLQEHHFNKCKIWFMEGYHTYFSNPWAIIGFLGAFIALSLTFIQTWFSVFPR
ncbi:hypothetical protein RYX36_006905 [Vicia faba]